MAKLLNVPENQLDAELLIRSIRSLTLTCNPKTLRN
jgi:hypothetical protein